VVRYPHVTVALAYPNAERAALKDPGFRALSTRLGGHQDLACEQVFLPEEEPGALLRPEPSFHFFLLFLSEEHDALNLLRLLQMRGLPLPSKERDSSSPIVLLVGPLASTNPEPLADFVDAVLVEEEAWEETVALYRAVKEQASPSHWRGLFLKRLVTLPGLYVPRFYQVRYKDDGTVAKVVAKEGAPSPVRRHRPLAVCSGLGEPSFRQEETIALAPWAGTARLRKLIGEVLDDEVFFKAVDRFAQSTAHTLQVVFAIGLPTETDEDTLAIPELAKRVKHRILEKRRGDQTLREIVVSVRTFVPKPWTIFQWAPMEEVAVLEARLRAIKRILKGVSHVRLVHDLPKWAYLQAVLARGDRRTAGLLLLGLRYRGDWPLAFQEWPLNPDFYARRRRSLAEVLPWDHLWEGKEHLVERYRETGLV